MSGSYNDSSDNSDSSINIADSGNDNSVNTDNSDSSDNSVTGSYITDSSTTSYVLTLTELASTVTDVSVNAGGHHDTPGVVTTGDVEFEGSALTNFAGINTAAMNSGIGSANQAVTSISATASINIGGD